MSSRSEVGTQPLELSSPLTVRTLAVEVMSGDDVMRRVEAPEDRLTVGTSRANHVVLEDGTVSRFHLELSHGAAGIHVRDLESKNGTHLGTTSLQSAWVAPGTELTLGRTRIRVQSGETRAVDASDSPELHGILGTSPQMRRLMGTLGRVAASEIAVLVTGESGTGKELVARAVHEASPRAGGPFVVVDCGALTPSLVTSALFGHEKGAFTGAERRHKGAFERASGGTVFLDEVGELSPELQPQLLGVLERKRFLRVGGSEEVAVDVRVVCATNRELRGEVNRSAFREDLYYRLSVVTLEVPSLRERLVDLPLLTEFFFREMGNSQAFGSVFSREVLEQMSRHDWPGNVRELRNFVETMVVVGEAPPQRTSRPPGEPETPASELSPELLQMRYADARAAILSRFEQKYFTHLLGSTSGNVSAAARTASMDRSYLIKLLEKHGLKQK